MRKKIQLRRESCMRRGSASMSDEHMCNAEAYAAASATAPLAAVA